MMVQLQNNLLKVFVAAVLFSNAHSKGSPWDWQSVNAKYPYEQQQHQQQMSGRQGLVNGRPITLQVNNNVTVLVGDTAQLPCRVRNLGEYTVSWLRGRDTSVLSVGHHTFSSDQRFSVVQVPRPRLSAADWNLEIKSVTLKDSGWYDCQVNTEPKISNKSYLTVEEAGPWIQQVQEDKMQDSPVQHREVIPEIQEFLQPRGAPRTEIAGPPVLRLPPGETLSLECTVSRLAAPPSSLYWTHNEQVITPEENPGVSLESEKLAGVSHSRLVVVNLQTSDEGTYACVTDISSPATVELFLEAEQSPIVMAQVGKKEDGNLKKGVSQQQILDCRALQASVDHLAQTYDELNSRVQMLEDSDGAEALASRVSSSTIPVSTVLLLSIVLSIVHILTSHLADIR